MNLSYIFSFFPECLFIQEHCPGEEKWRRVWGAMRIFPASGKLVQHEQVWEYQRFGFLFFSGRQGAEEELLSPCSPYVCLWVWWKFDSRYENFPALFPCKVLILTVWHFQPLCWKNLYALNAKRMQTVMQRLIHLIPFFFFSSHARSLIWWNSAHSVQETVCIF